MAKKAWATKEVVDPSTGETHRLFYILAPKDIDTSFVKVFIPFLEEVFNDKELVGKAFRLLLWIVKRLDWNELKVTMNAKMVCKDLQVTDRTYRTWKRTLIRKEIIFPDPESRETFYLKPYTVIRGSMAKIDF